MNLRTEAPGTITTRPGANPIGKLYRIKLRYVGFEHSDWLINSFNQSEGLKPILWGKLSLLNQLQV